MSITASFPFPDDTLGLEYEPGTGKRQVYLRRLYGSYDSGRGLLLDDLDKVCGRDDGGGNGIVRPAAVLTRIKQLNLNAKAFADTILALQQRQNGDCGGRAGRRCLAAPRSLQHSPSHSCSMISLMDIDRWGQQKLFSQNWWIGKQTEIELFSKI